MWCLPILSAKRPINILPPRPIRVPDPIKPFHMLVIFRYLLAASIASPLIPKLYPHAICPKQMAI